MKIAVTYENGEVFQHFGHCAQFKIYEIVNDKLENSYVVDTAGSGHGALAAFLAEQQVDAVLCGGIGGGAVNALAGAGIQVYGGISGNTDDVIDALLNGGLTYSPNATCSHHDGEEGHDCGSHGCGEHGCGEHGCGGHGCH